jgi:hypothetical protein
MNTDQIQAYISVAEVLYAAGIEIVGKFKELLAVLHPGHTLTDDQINAIEQAGMLDSQRRQAERIAMAQPSV